MPQVGFKKQFIQKVMTEEKPFTLRELRKDGRDTRAGQTLYIYTGLRSKQCQKHGEKPCRFAVTVNLSWRSILIPTIGSLKTPALLESFSRLDGFESYAAFCEFHKVAPGMKSKPMRLVAWITRDELAKLL
jgi:hypothetical protein